MSPTQTVPFREALRVWLRVAANSFGGPAGQISVMHSILVEEKKWVSESRFLHALNYCMLLPGPEAQQLATYIGWLMHGTRGGLVAGGLFILPGFVSILALSYIYLAFQDVGVVAALFFGVKPAVLAVVTQAAVRIGKKILRNGAMLAIAAAALGGIFLLRVPFPVIILCAAVTGLIGNRIRPDLFQVAAGHGRKSDADDADDADDKGDAIDALPSPASPPLSRSIRILALFGLLWFGPLVILAPMRPAADVYFDEGVFFSKSAVVTFGGAYSVLSYIAEEAVGTHGWLEPGEMLDGLGMAESTPGPLIQVVQFVGFMGAARNPGGLHPMAAGTLGAIITTWVTFVPCFLWIFLGAPYVEALRGIRALSAALSAVTAAVAGVIVNLALWFGMHTLFGSVNEFHFGPVATHVPEWGTISLPAAALAAAAMIAMFRFRVGMLPTLAASCAAGVLLHFAGL